MNAVRGPSALELIASAQAEAEPRLGGGPVWASRRRQALARLQAHGLPTRRDENWKYLNLRAVEKREFRAGMGRETSSAALQPHLVPLRDACRVVLVDGRYSTALSSPERPPGLGVTGLDAALAAAPDAWAERLPSPGDGADERFALLAEAFAGQGLLLEVASDTALQPIVYLVHVSTGATAGATHARVRIESGRHCRWTLVEHFISLGHASVLSNLHSEVVVGEGARLDHYRVQQLDPATALIDTRQVQVLADGHYDQHDYALGAAVDRMNLHLVLDGAGAQSVVNGLFVADGLRQVDLYTLVEHARPHTRSEQVFRGMATAAGRGAYNGKVIVRPGAQKADSSQSSRNLLLSPAAEICARPQLEIYADDVKCSHGTTVGQLDEAQFFYLLSRGLDRATAQGLLTFAFCEDVLQRVRPSALRRHLEEAVVGRLPDRDLIREFV